MGPPPNSYQVIQNDGVSGQEFLPPDLQLQNQVNSSLGYCFGKWSTGDRSMLIGNAKKIRESNILGLHNSTIFSTLQVITNFSLGKIVWKHVMCFQYVFPEEKLRNC
jgi:hypothetical protein